MKLLHEYNDLKDATQILIGSLANLKVDLMILYNDNIIYVTVKANNLFYKSQGVTVAELHKKYELPTSEQNIMTYDPNIKTLFMDVLKLVIYIKTKYI